MSERYVTLAEVKKLLLEESDKRELLTSQKAALDHAQAVSYLSVEDTQSIIEEVSKLDKVTDRIAIKIADILPKYPNDVRAIFYKERVELTADDIQEILDIVAKYIEHEN
jgi:DNA-directed RNA polymerase subunit F